jgi:prepilin-type N-terminal cleavage/methylation domain-containing protein
MRNKKAGQRGVSLLEVLVALFILSVAGVAIVGGAYVNIQSTGAARTNIRAEGLAKYEMEYMKSAAKVPNNWTNTGKTGIADQVNHYSYTITVPPATPPAPGPKWDTAHTGSDIATEYAGYSVTIEIDWLDAPYDANIRKVTSTVKYQGKEEASIETYLVNSP